MPVIFERDIDLVCCRACTCLFYGAAPCRWKSQCLGLIEPQVLLNVSRDGPKAFRPNALRTNAEAQSGKPLLRGRASVR